jgi:hypothetical protein
MNAIYLDAAMVPAQLRGGYSGKKFKAVVVTQVVIPSDAGLWSGGTRSTYSIVDLASGRTIGAPCHQEESPWGNRREFNLEVKPGFTVVEHSLFCGKDMGLTFYVHPDNAAKLLPAPAPELSEHESIVLGATCSFKSSYNGQDRYTMAKTQAEYPWRRDDSTPQFPTREQWQVAKDSLISKGLLNKAGAVTPKGRNARPPRS